MSAVPDGWSLLVARGVEHGPGALDALLAARETLSGGVLYASAVDGDGAWPRILDKPAAIDAAAHGLVALRAIVPGALLVRSDLVPPGPLTFAWTARVLADRPGYLVPASRARRTGPSPRVGLRPLLASGWSREERLWLLMRAAGERERESGEEQPDARM